MYGPPASGPPTYGAPIYGTPGYGAAPPQPPANKRMSTAAIIAIVVGGVLALCCIGGVAIAAFSDPPKDGKDTTSAGQPAVGATQTTAGPAKTPPKAAASTFNLALGTPVTVTSGSGTVEVTVTAAKWQAAGCKGGMGPDDSYLVVDVTVKITSGSESINPLFFDFVTSGGNTVNSVSGMFAGCKDLGSGNGFPAGTVRSGQLVYDAPRGAGVVQYSHSFRQAGSWVIPA